MRTVGRAGLAVTAVMVLIGSGGGSAWAANHGGTGRGGSPAGTGIDVSYPQCPANRLPTGESFAVVGVNGGLANDYNTCLATEFSYARSLPGTTAQAKAQTYLNTADPGNSVADWPSPAYPGAAASDTDPYGTCGFANGTAGPGASSDACAWAYGYDMVAGITDATTSVPGDAVAFHQATGGQLYAQPVWLDVETTNSWLSGTGGQQMNAADLQGMVAATDDAARRAGSTAPVVGVYTTAAQWSQIVGTTTLPAQLAGAPDWIPGAGSEAGAQSNCGQPSFTAGRVAVAQWTASYDYDYSC
jgi:hypothetical protein